MNDEVKILTQLNVNLIEIILNFLKNFSIKKNQNQKNNSL